jgi:hypothetical protein
MSEDTAVPARLWSEDRSRPWPPREAAWVRDETDLTSARRRLPGWVVRRSPVQFRSGRGRSGTAPFARRREDASLADLRKERAPAAARRHWLGPEGPEGPSVAARFAETRRAASVPEGTKSVLVGSIWQGLPCVFPKERVRVTVRRPSSALVAEAATAASFPGGSEGSCWISPDDP